MTPPSSLRILGLLLLALCSTFVVAGCTERQDPTEYRDRLAAVLDARDTVVEQLDGKKLSGSQYDTAQESLRRALEDFDAQAPPREYAKAHELMVDSVDGLSVLLGKLRRCDELEQSSLQDARACRQSIGQDVFDTLRNDFAESDAIYRQEGLSLSQLGDGDDQSDASGDGGDVLS